MQFWNQSFLEFTVNKMNNRVIEDLSRIFSTQKENAKTVACTTAAERIEKLRKLRDAVLEHKREIEQALYNDFKKNTSETLLTEIFVISEEIKHAVRHLKKWMKPVRVMPPLTFPGSRCRIHYVPKGVCLIISPWNYPFLLALSPVVSAVAAGNCVMVKPSERSPHTSAVIRKIVESLFPENEAAVVEGDVSVGKALLELPFDHIYFTGSPAVGRIVMEAAAKNLTSVTLELGGKSPVFIDETTNIDQAAKRIAWGKFINCGQTCVAPDYVLINENSLDNFIRSLIIYVEKMYGPYPGIRKNADYCRIISRPHFEKIRILIDDAVNRGAKIEAGGDFNGDDCYISPTILTGVPLDALIMSEEIFGPVLPVLNCQSVEDAVRIINDRPNPLALYVFGGNKEVVNEIVSQTSPGDVLVNDTVVHCANVRLPFGGVRSSGIGKTHGSEGFRAFSHVQSVMKQPALSTIQMFYPPYTDKVRKLLDLAVKYL